MLSHPTLDILQNLGLHGCVKGLKELSANTATASLSHEEWLSVLLEHEVTYRNQRIYDARIGRAKLRHRATVEAVDFHTSRGLDKVLFLKLASCRWIREHRHVILTGKTGLGKSWLACALAHNACRENIAVLYQRAPRLFGDLDLARSLGRHGKLLANLRKARLLIIDDFGPETLGPEQRRDLLEIVEDRMGCGSLIITSQAPVNRWHDVIGEPTLADAILDRIVHSAYRIVLEGDSMRKAMEESVQS